MPIQHTIRALQSSDLPFLRQMISLAADWRASAVDMQSLSDSPSPRDVERDYPRVEGEVFLARYVSGWGRPGDAGFVADVSRELDVYSPSPHDVERDYLRVEGEAGKPVGMASYRLFSSTASGYGFVDEKTPEISLAVLHDYRRNGIGTALLKALLERASADGYGQVSLSVNKQNPAVQLYRKAGFSTVATQPNSLTMVCSLSEF